MTKEIWKPGNMIYPVPAVLVSMKGLDGRENIVTVAWTGTICTNPAMAYISLRPTRFSYDLIRESGEFAINLTTEALAFATDYCGVKSGREVDKFSEMKLTKERASQIQAPLIGESPVNIECRVREIHPYGSHHMFVADVLAVQADKEFFDASGKFDLGRAGIIAYSHGEYYCLGKKLGKFGWSVKKNKKRTSRLE
ncbi:flavin reductase family protein [Hominifimenecus sp. rT4P-3]|uniref:flavin reductase family protein n=1 Tax=Hominifimenecus sp. rT4P-3 TaxID=3242979 RepID=UPI003DA54A67